MDLTKDEIKMLLDLVEDERYNYGEKYFKRCNTSSDVMLYKLREMLNEVN